MKHSWSVKLLALLLAAVLLAGCGPVAAPTEPAATQPPTEAPTQTPTQPALQLPEEFPVVPSDPVVELSGELTLNGVALKEYTLVYAADADPYTQNAVDYIRRQLLEYAKVELPVITDDAPENAYEILVGQTRRPLSQALTPPEQALQYALLAQDGHIALEGEYFLIAAAAYGFVQSCISAGENAVVESGSYAPQTAQPHSIAFLIGDGMGPNQTRLFADTSLTQPEDYHDSLEQFYGYLLPYQGMVHTGSVSGTTDSAASATALACGIKTINRYVAKDKYRNDVLSITEVAAMLGKATAVMSTEDSTGATPACFSAHAQDRNDDDDILASQAALSEKLGTVIVCGLNELEPTATAFRQPLAQTLSQLSQSDKGFFLMYEEAYIDKNAHKRKVQETYDALLRFQQAVGMVLEYACYHPGTLVLITADHETGGLTENPDGTFVYTGTEHTDSDVPLFVFGQGGELFDGFLDENTRIPQLLLSLWNVENFGDAA